MASELARARALVRLSVQGRAQCRSGAFITCPRLCGCVSVSVPSSVGTVVQSFTQMYLIALVAHSAGDTSSRLCLCTWHPPLVSGGDDDSPVCRVKVPARPPAWLQSEPIDGGESSHLTFAARRLLGSARFGSNPSSANKICSNPVCMSANGARLRHKQDARDSLCLWLICRRRRRRLADKRARRNMIAHNRSQASRGNQIKTQPPASEFGSQCLARVRLQRSRREARSKLQAH